MSRNVLEKTIERVLGRQLKAEDMGRVKHLNDINNNLIDETRKLGSALMQRAFLAYYVDPLSHAYLNAFIEEVIEGSTDVSEWRRGSVIVPDWSITDQLNVPRQTLLEPIGNDFTHYLEPNLRDWHDCVSWIGAPALLQPDSDYLSRHHTVAHTVSLALCNCNKIESHSVAVRRWHAARMSSILAKYQDIKNVATIEDIASPSFPPFNEWSDDAIIAANALILELNSPDILKLDAIPGFSGPREWYED